MFNFTLPHKLPSARSLARATVLLYVAAQVGCRNAAYSDLYVESMAAEIRQLEDQLYEYDNEYHVLEKELASLRAENQKLRTTPATSDRPQSGLGKLLAPKESSPAPLEFAPRDPLPVPSPSSNSNSVPSYSPPTEQLPAKKPESILEPPDASNSPTEQERLQNSLPQIPVTPPKTDVPNDLLDIPTIDPGTPLPPGMPVLKDRGGSTGFSANNPSGTAPSNNLELNLSRIEVPNQLASTQSNSAAGNRALLKLGSEKPADMRIVEIAFHPTLTRAANFDDESDDDGLYLVLQPKNTDGQLVPTFADLEIAVLDPAREGDSNAARIGRWSYSAIEVKTKFQPIGTSQGIHLTLPWNGPDPVADRVVVFVRYTLPDGRQVVNDKTIFVSGKGNMKTVWVPRSTDNSAVVTASAQQPIASPSNPSNVVRPPASRSEPAPVPMFR